MKRILLLICVLFSMQLSAQTQSSLPAGSVPFGSVFIATDGAVWAGATGKTFKKIGLKEDVTRLNDSIAALRTSINGKVDKITGKGLSTEDYSTAEKSKLSGIATYAEVNVNADWNAVSGDAQILNKPTVVSTEVDPVFTAQKGVNNGVATLNSSGKIPNAQIPALALVDTYVTASQAAMLALSSAEQGDVAIRTDLSKTFILTDNAPATLASWKELLSPIIPAETDPVWGASASAGITGGDISAWNAKQMALAGTGLVKSTGGTISYLTDNSSNWNTAYSYSQVGHLPLGGGTLTGGLIGTSAGYSGNVGAGTTNPQARLHVAGTYGVLIDPSATIASIIGTNAAGTSSDALRIAGFPLIFTGNGGGGVEHMRLNSSGELLINTSTSSGDKVNVDGSGKFSGNLTIPSLKITTGANNGYVLTSDADGDGTWVSPASGLTYKGAWNASTNNPTLADGVGTTGWMYAVSTGGTQFSRTFIAGGFAIYNGSIWEPVGTSAAVTSVNSLTGTVQLNPTLSGTTVGITGGTSTVDISGISITGNSATSTLASNSTQWNGVALEPITYTSGTIASSLLYNSTNSRVEFGTASTYKSWLGIGDGSTLANSISGLSANSTQWNGYTNDFAGAGAGTATNAIVEESGVLKRASQGTLRIFLGLGSNAYNSTSFYHSGNPQVNVTGNSGTTTLASNSTQWNGYTNDFAGAGASTISNAIIEEFGILKRANSATLATFLGLGSNAYYSTAYAPLASPSFTGTVSGITAGMVGAPSGSGSSTGTNTGDQTWTTLSGKPTFASVATSGAYADLTGTPTIPSITGLAPLASPTFTGTVSGITAGMVGAPSGSGSSTGTNTGDQTWTTLSGKPSFATVATTGAYADLTGTPSLASYQTTSNLSTTTTLGTSNTLYPSQNAVKTYVDNNTVSGRGTIILSGDGTTTTFTTSVVESFDIAPTHYLLIATPIDSGSRIAYSLGITSISGTNYWTVTFATPPASGTGNVKFNYITVPL